MARRDRYGQDAFTELSFRKTGGEIQTAITARLVAISKEVNDEQAHMAEICKRREVDLAEVLEAGDDADKVTAYSMKISSSVPRHAQTSPIMRELEREVDRLRSGVLKIAQAKEEAEHLERVSKNLDSENVSYLSYTELVTFGF